MKLILNKKNEYFFTLTLVITDNISMKENKLTKHIISLLILLSIFSTVFFTVNTANASTFIRRKKKERKDDARYGKNWSKMDRDLDRGIDGNSSRNNNDRNSYRRNRRDRRNRNQRNR